MSKVSFDFSGERFIVTGASSGIGRQIASELAGAGATVLAIARRAERLSELKENYPERIVPGVLDVRDTEKLREVMQAFVREYGKFHGAVHAAGTGASTPLRAYDETIAREIMDISFWSGIRLMQLVNMKKHSEPKCSSVLFSSVSAYVGEKTHFAYSAAKSALQTAVRTLAKEIYPEGRRINTVSPGWVDTPLAQGALESGTTDPKMLDRLLLGRGRTEDVSGVVLFLLSNRGQWITGTDIVIDGGYLYGGYN